MTLSEKIRSEKERRDLSDAQLAFLIRRTPANVGQILRGDTSGSTELLERVARVLEIDADELHLLSAAMRFPKALRRGIETHAQEILSLIRGANTAAERDQTNEPR